MSGAVVGLVSGVMLGAVLPGMSNVVLGGVSCGSRVVSDAVLGVMRGGCQVLGLAWS